MVFTREQNITLVGDPECGKTSLLKALKQDRFPEKEVPTEPFILVSHTEDDGQLVRVLSFVWDIPVFEEWKTFHPFYYGHTDVVVLCFSVDSPESLRNASKKWLLEIKSYCKPDVPVILVGNKSDLRVQARDRSKNKRNVVTPEAAKAAANRIGAFVYMECSAVNQEGVKEVFKTAAKAPMNKKRDALTALKTNDTVDSLDKTTKSCCTVS